MSSFEVLTMGRIGVDVYPDQIGVGLDEVTSFGKYLGGSSSICAIAGGRSIDVTMGFSPQSGLENATRHGDLDVFASRVVRLLDSRG